MKQADLRDVTFLLILRLDSIQRLENVLAVSKYLVRNLNTNIHLLESDRTSSPILKKLLPKEMAYRSKWRL